LIVEQASKNLLIVNETQVRGAIMKSNTRQVTKSTIVLKNLEIDIEPYEELNDKQIKGISGGDWKTLLAFIDERIKREKALAAAATVGLISPIDPIATTINVTVGQTPGLTNR
jgi:hypothetical protein